MIPSHAPFDTPFAHTIFKGKYPFTPQEEWDGCSERVVGNVLTQGLSEAPGGHRVLKAPGVFDRLHDLVRKRLFIPGGRYLYGSGRPFHQVNNCLLMRAEDTREGWSRLKYQAFMALMTGAGIGVYYGDVREKNSTVSRTGGIASGPVPLMETIDQDGFAAVQGGDRRCAIWAGLPWWHPDIDEFLRVKDWPKWMRDAIKKRNEGDPDYKKFRAPMESTNVSVCLDDEFFAAYNDECHPRHALAHKVYWKAIEKMTTHGEPGFSVDLGDRSNEQLRNACTEVTSEDDSDVCNLGSVVLPRFQTPEQFGEAVRDAALFLTAGSLYSDVSYDKVADVRDKNRRLGLGIIGVHEFCMQNGVRYGTNDSFELLDPYMRQYARALEFANDWQDRLRVSRSVAATAIAPNGTIGILAESTPSADPMPVASKKRVVITASPSGDIHTTHVVIDPVARRLHEQGVPAELIEDVFTIDYERRIAMQAYIQCFVDQAVSSTINIDRQLFEQSDQRDFGNTLMRYLPQLRGVTAYPDGARPGQPIQPIPFEYALEHEGETWIEGTEGACASGMCGV
jgi:ribonucleoside-diphosphate reductase alpha chain